MKVPMIIINKTNLCSGTDALALFGFEWATTFGAVDFLTTLANIFPVEIIPEHLKHQFLTNSLMSDCPKTFKEVYLFTNAVNEEVINIAK